jgi:hypothetical protein
MDAQIRRLERAAQTGDPEAVARLRAARRRAGDLPVAGEYVRLDGAAISRPEATGNWRVLALLARGALTESVVGAETVTLGPVTGDRAPIDLVGAVQLITLSVDDLAAARVEADAPLRNAPLLVPCPRCSADEGQPCVTPHGVSRKPHVIRGAVPVLVPEPLPPEVRLISSRTRPSIVRVVESRNPNAHLRWTAADLAARRAVTENIEGP